MPKPITAANNHTFHMMGKCDLMISLPNGKGHSCICLQDILYAPKMGIMLVSISKLDLVGYAVLFHDKCCQIFNAQKKRLGEVPLNKGLYCVKSPCCIFAGLTKASDPLTMAIERWWSAQGLACRKEGKRSVGNLSSLASYYVLVYTCSVTTRYQ